MKKKNKSFTRKTQLKKEGSGLLNTIINKLPFELHLPGYNYCGPGTKLEKRLRRGDKGINPLDEACKSHDIAYAQNQSLEQRHKADLELASVAEKRLYESPDILEKVAALGVNKMMKFKVKRGMGVSLSKVITDTRKALKQYSRGNNKNHSRAKLISAAMKAAKKSMKGKHLSKKPRVIRLPKSGGFLPLIPILGALAAAGSFAGGVSTVAKNIYDMVKKKDKEPESAARASTTPVAVGKGMYMAPYKKGMGLYLSPYQKN